jgi:cytochrome c peroxidase
MEQTFLPPMPDKAEPNQLLRTAPYMHDGSLARIEDVVRHYSELNEERLHADGERILRRLDLTPGQAADLAAFLRSLSPPTAR